MSSKKITGYAVPFVVGVVLLIVGCVLAFVVFPNIIAGEIKKSVQLEEDTIQWYRFKEIPFPMRFAVNFFTIDNPIETTNGAKPVVREIGPYVYKERRTKIVHKIEEDTVTYDELWSFEFDASASGGGRSEDDVIEVVNAPLMAVIQNLENLPIALPVPIERILDDIFEDTRVFQKVRVKDYAFGGIRMCDPRRSTTGYSKLICLAIMMMNQKLLEYHEDLSMSFSLFGYKTKPDGAFTLKRGIKALEKLGLITSYKGQEYTKYWKGEKTTCDKVDGFYTTYPPHMKDEGSWRVYSTDICKGATLNYAGPSKYKNVEGYRFQTDRYSFAAADEECVCIEATKGLSGENHCFRDGVLDLNTCMGAPVILSFPHLMWADERYRDSVDGLTADGDHTDAYNTVIDFEPNTGLPLRGGIKIQFNLVVRPVTYGGVPIDSTKSLAGALLPILWLEDSFALTDNLIEEINEQLISKLYLVDVISWTVIGVSIFMILLTIVLFICCRCVC